jgi:hypothetical protein
MAFGNGPKIVTDGLVLALDAADKNSYPGTGTSWSDLSGNNYSGSLVNSPTFSSTNGGGIVFNGTNQYASFTTAPIITVGSTSIWFNTTNAGASYRALINRSLSWGLFLLDNVLITYDWGNSANRTTNLNVATGTWQNAVLTFSEITGTPSNNAIIYLNGTSVLTTTIKNSTPLNFQIAAQNAGQTFSGNIANAQVYNRVLSPTEVLQNYNALKSRFNLR